MQMSRKEIHYVNDNVLIMHCINIHNDSYLYDVVVLIVIFLMWLPDITSQDYGKYIFFFLSKSSLRTNINAQSHSG